MCVYTQTSTILFYLKTWQSACETHEQYKQSPLLWIDQL